jgi:two-component system, NtrC family, response regulator AtoC
MTGMTTQPNILVVEDEPGMLRYMKTILELDSYQVTTADSGESAIECVRMGANPDVVLLDLIMPGIDGLQTLQQLRQLRPNLKVIMLSCVSDAGHVVKAMQLGAHNYLAKPCEKAELDAAVKQCTNVSASAGVAPAVAELEELGNDLFFLAANPAMRNIRTHVKKVANVDVPVLILGESGSGKEIVARLIHKYSSRSHRMFLKVNCAALPSELLESELFGYESGAFTGATRSKPGKFELCDKGTILLDEIGEMSPALQSKMLHVLQDQEFSRLGGRSTVKVNVRILAATNIDVPDAIANKKLREDLYYRLNAFTIKLPPLRERKDEIPILLKHFMTRFAESYAKSPLLISSRLIETCQKYHWPGNLRELANFVKRYLILGDESWALRELDLSPQSDRFSDGSPNAAADPDRGLKSIVRGLKDEAELVAISRALEKTAWNRKQAAGLLRISYKALLYKIRQYKIDRPQYRASHYDS